MDRIALIALVAGLLSAVAPATVSAASGRILVAGDENWTALNGATTLTLAKNIAAFLAPAGGAKFLFHIENNLPWLKGASFVAGLTGGGNTITFDGGPPSGFNHNLGDYDAVFVARQYAAPTTIPTAQLIAYVQAGGNVVVSLGSGLNNDTGAQEAAAWNPFLNAFGLSILPLYHALVGDIPIVSSDALMNGVTSLYHNVGAIITLTGADAHAHLVATYPTQTQGQGLFAVYRPTGVALPPTAMVAPDQLLTANAAGQAVVTLRGSGAAPADCRCHIAGRREPRRSHPPRR